MLASVAFRDGVGAEDGATRLVCPLCTFDQQQLLRWTPLGATTLVLEIEGGCGCRWQLHLERSERRTHTHVQIVQPCDKPFGLQPVADAEVARRLLDEHEL